MKGSKYHYGGVTRDVVCSQDPHKQDSMLQSVSSYMFAWALDTSLLAVWSICGTRPFLKLVLSLRSFFSDGAPLKHMRTRALIQLNVQPFSQESQLNIEFNEKSKKFDRFSPVGCSREVN